ncbi:hypothetical protein [Bradyrhizobium brasilense]|uniref:hypothetical protein n=1 Tax=Bradyrhizobium brasilense TaxID=1419277 RepID=UPI001177EBF7|nr:hypothetical protein [Bradyrhizobium brasilense]
MSDIMKASRGLRTLRITRSKTHIEIDVANDQRFNEATGVAEKIDGNDIIRKTSNFSQMHATTKGLMPLTAKTNLRRSPM